MTIEDLIKGLIKIEKEKDYDPEGMHAEQDKLLLKYIDNPKVTKIFNRTRKFYA